MPINFITAFVWKYLPLFSCVQWFNENPDKFIGGTKQLIQTRTNQIVLFFYELWITLWNLDLRFKVIVLFLVLSRLRSSLQI